MGISIEEAGELYYGTRDFEKATVVYKYERGKPLVTTEQEYRDLPIYMRQLHDYYTIDTCTGDCVGFQVCIPPRLVFNHPEEVVHSVYYEDLFPFFQRRSLDTQILMLWSM